MLSLICMSKDDTNVKIKVLKNLANLKLKYSRALNGQIENDPIKIENFTKYVLSSLAEPVIIPEISNLQRYRCLFSSCVSKVNEAYPSVIGKSFASKQKYVQHLCIDHDQELPGSGQFILANDKSTKAGGFWCSTCGHRGKLRV